MIVIFILTWLKLQSKASVMFSLLDCYSILNSFAWGSKILQNTIMLFPCWSAICDKNIDNSCMFRSQIHWFSALKQEVKKFTSLSLECADIYICSR